MNIQQTLLFIFLPLALIIVASLAKKQIFWSTLANHTLPWLCSCIAITTLIVGTTCLLSGKNADELSTNAIIAVCSLIGIIFGTGLLVDYYSYQKPKDWTAALGEWIGFMVLLIGSFLLTKI